MGNAQVMNEIAALATTPPRQSVALAQMQALRGVVTSSGRRLRHLSSLPMYGADRRVIGGIALLCQGDAPLDPTEWALFDSIVLQAAQAFDLRLAGLCEKYGIAELSVFGSVARGDARPDSDVDLLYVRIPGNDLGMSYFALQEDLEKLFGRPVDLVPKEGLHRVIRIRF